MKRLDYPISLVIFGATGDLARKKLFPALLQLYNEEVLPKQFRILAIARQPLDSRRFREELAEFLNEQKGHDGDHEGFLLCTEYISLDAHNADDYQPLAQWIKKGQEQQGAVDVFYLSVSPSLYGVITQHLRERGCINGKTRSVIEKPLGHDLESARVIQKSLAETFQEEQTYRIDHYLGKETVQNLLALRFGNSIFEPLWCAQQIDHIQITVAETVGVGDRGSYYDQSGAMRDMVQNHLLQLLCIVAMEPPAKFDPFAVRDEKLKVLQALKPIMGSDVLSQTVRGQYHCMTNPQDSYLREPGVAADSTTETYVGIKTQIENWRWAGMPFYLRTGKKLLKRRSEIRIQFKPVPHPLFRQTSTPLAANQLIIRLQPEESIRLMVNAKSPGKGMNLDPVALDLNLAQDQSRRRWDAYERLLLDVFAGDLTLFMREKDIEAAWCWVDPIIEAWQELGLKPSKYEPGSWGPVEADQMLAKDGNIWHNR